MKLVYINCDICKKNFNRGNIVYNDLNLYFDTLNCLEGKIKGHLLYDIDYITREYLNIDICPECTLKISKCIELIENNRGELKC